MMTKHIDFIVKGVLQRSVACGAVSGVIGVEHHDRGPHCINLMRLVRFTAMVMPPTWAGGAVVSLSGTTRPPCTTPSTSVTVPGLIAR
jgi:hypothetical protein